MSRRNPYRGNHNRRVLTYSDLQGINDIAGDILERYFMLRMQFEQPPADPALRELAGLTIAHLENWLIRLTITMRGLIGHEIPTEDQARYMLNMEFVEVRDRTKANH